MKTITMNTLIILMSALLISSCAKEEEKPPVIPNLLFSDIKVVEGDAAGKKAIITIDLSEATTAAVGMRWSTEDGTAKAGEDYEAVTGQELTFTPGELYRTIEINVVSDDILEFHEWFSIKLTDITNATVVSPTIKVTIENDDTYQATATADGYITPSSYPGMTLVWSDEFDASVLNTTDWNYETGGGGWGNNEWEIYTNSTDNSFLQDGLLNIKATKHPYNGNYYSARLTTKGKKEFTYGRIDIRAKMPIGKGIWPALWMLGGNISSVGWPACGEIDIMEYLGHEPLKVHGTAHYNDGGHKYKGGSYTVPEAENLHEKFHVFSIIWQENSIEWFIDYRRYYTVTSSTVKFDAFNLPQFFIFNVAVGGNWPGYPDATTQFPQTMLVDYVRVFQ